MQDIQKKSKPWPELIRKNQTVLISVWKSDGWAANPLNIQIFICWMWSRVSVWGCFYFSSRQGDSGAAPDSVALLTHGNVSLPVLLKGFNTWMWEGSGTSELCMPEDPLQCPTQPQLCLPVVRLSKRGFLMVKAFKWALALTVINGPVHRIWICSQKNDQPR